MIPGTRAISPRPHRRTVRGWAYTSMQALRGYPVDRFARELAAAEALPPEEFDRRCARRLSDALEYARDRVPLYGGGAWAGVQGPQGAEIAPWPLLEREVLRARQEELLPRQHRARTSTLGTSGSSGASLAIRMSREAEAWGWAHRYRGLLWHGLPIGVRSLRLSHRRRPLRDFLLGQHCVSALDTPGGVDDALKYLVDERPPLVAGSPSMLFYLARRLRERGHYAPVVPFARVGGEQLFGFQRAAIQQHLAGRALDSYGCTEIGAIAGECEAGSMHVYADHVHLEIFEGERPADPGAFGDIVLTALRNRAMPLVRYRVGDRGRLLPGRCRCGLPHPVLADLQARTADSFLGVDGTRHHASELVTPLAAVYGSGEGDGIRQVQFEQVAPLAWRVWVEREQDGRLGAAQEDRLAGIVRDVAGAGSSVEVLTTRSIPRERGKFRYYRLQGGSR
jgi:phenylacetate-CoA ligase